MAVVAAAAVVPSGDDGRGGRGRTWSQQEILALCGAAFETMDSQCDQTKSNVLEQKCAECFPRCVLCVLCVVCCVLRAVCCVLCAVCCVLCAVCCVLYAVCCVLYAVCCVL